MGDTIFSCGKNCSDAFTAVLRDRMQDNNVDSVLLESIQANTSASAQVVSIPVDQTEADRRRPKSSIVPNLLWLYILIGLSGFLAVSTAVVAVRRSPTTKSNV